MCIQTAMKEIKIVVSGQVYEKLKMRAAHEHESVKKYLTDNLTRAVTDANFYWYLGPSLTELIEGEDEDTAQSGSRAKTREKHIKSSPRTKGRKK